ncbi:hypothetical protein C1645_839798 [Glomus cerebriforme]|uniref:Uncharacterized protein n=1 Tax=Glomus cerebriforme TaxID=658196 RepID=A0A397S031_9GLOM|nr:hypothetical protein C1645_839798 [Glomus cerebriforme]
MSNIPDKHDVMIMLYIHPAEIKNLHISNGSDVISSGKLRDPEKPGALWFNTFLKKDEFLPKIGKLLLPSSLHNLGSVFAVAIHCVKNLSKAGTISDEALRHSSDNHASPSKRYIIGKEENHIIRQMHSSSSMKTDCKEIKENISIEASIDTCADVNCIIQKHIGELGIIYHSESNSIATYDATYSTIEKVNLHISFNDSKNHKSTPVEFIVLGPDWPGPDLILGGP